MASFFNLTLDTLAPEELTVTLNDGAEYTTSATVTLKLTLTDEETTGYQMKIWGVNDINDEGTAEWETYTAQKSITLTPGDGLKTVSVKVRDDVGNESAAATDTITLDTKVPTVTITGPDKPKISKVTGFNVSRFSFVVDAAFEEYKVCVVPQTSSTQDAGTVIPTTAGSSNTSGSGDYKASTKIDVVINGTDLATVSSGDGVKIIKVFVRTSSGLWSVA